MEILNGKDVKNKKIEELKEKIAALKDELGLAIIQIGYDEACNVYVKQKEKLANELGIKFIHKTFLENDDETDIIKYIDELNADNQIDGILIQMPIPKKFNTSKLQNKINPVKDVDGLTYINCGKLVQNNDSLIPCTPKGIIDLLDYYKIDIEGKNAVVIGRSILVGKPMAALLSNRNATVTLCHSKTKNISFYTKAADIIVVAVGKENYLTDDMVSSGAIVIDVGINRVDGKLCGDVDYINVSKKTSYITPVPGGVGPMTVYELMNNVYIAHIIRNNSN